VPPFRCFKDLLADIIRSKGSTVEGCEYAAYLLFYEIIEQLVGIDEARRIGIDEARRIFRLFGSEPTANKQRDINKATVLDRLDLMPGKQNQSEIARQLADEAARGVTDPESQRITLRRWIEERELRDGKIHHELRAELEKLRKDLKNLD
jgi:hypothetical protein